ncbi:MAG TPA: DUF3891 family protein [Candidatus Acidoferrum sp.]
MILQTQNDPLVVIRQTDHAYLAGFFARELGNEAFAKPEPFSSFCLAAAEHDNGWQEWELAPGVDPKTFTLYTFMTVPTEEHISLYQHGIERVVKADMYAGMLVAGHCMGLYDRAHATIPGYSAKYVKSTEQHHANDFLQRLRLQQLRLKVDLRGNAAMKPYTDEKLVKENQQRLDALDRLSLYFCLGAHNDTTIEGVPVNEEGGEVDWELRSLGGEEFSLAPYPFRRDPLEFAILARRIPKARYTDDVELQKALVAAPYFNLRFTLRSGAMSEQSYAAGA